MNITRCTKEILLFLTILSFLPSFIGCSTSEKNNTNISNQLTIYVMENDTPTRNAVKLFNEKQKDYKIVEKTFSSEQEQEMGREAALLLLSGNGLDMVVCKSYMFPNLSKYMENGVFYDLNKLIERDGNFELTDYNKVVLDSGLFKGKRYIMPLDYSVDVFYTTDKLLKNVGVESSNPFSQFAELENQAAKYPNKSGKNNGYFLSGLSFDSLLRSNNKYVDQKGKKSNIENKEIASMLESYKKLSSSMYPLEKLTTITTMDDMSKLLSEENVIMLNTKISGVEYAWKPFSALKDGENVKIIPVPSADNSSHVTALPERMVVVNSKCKSTKTAFDFIKLMMSEDSQTNNEFAIPTNLRAFDKQIEEYSDQLKSGEQNDIYKKETVSQLTDIVKRVDRASIIDIELLKLIRDEISKYVGDLSSVDKTVKELEQQIQNYFSTQLQTSKTVNTENTGNSVNTQKISIYFKDYDINAKRAIKFFKDKYKQVQVDERCIKDYKQYNTIISAEILSGEGPDIIQFDSYTFNSLQKVLKSGAFEPLNKLIDNDKGFDKLDYFPSIIDAGKINGQYLFITLNCNVNILATTKKTLDKYEILPEKMEWSWDSFLELVNLKKMTNVIAPSLVFSQFLNSYGTSFIDYDNKTSNFNSTEFKKVLQQYKELWKSSNNDEIYAKYLENPSVIKANDALLINEMLLGSPSQVWTESSLFKVVLGEEIVLLPLPSKEGSKAKTYASIGDCVAINSKCKNKEMAYNYIKILISEGMQMAVGPDGNSNITIGVPVNRNAYMSDIKFYSSSARKDETISVGEHSSGRRQEYRTVPLTQNVIDQFGDIVSKIEKPVFEDYQILKVLSEEVSKYVHDKKSLEQTVRDIGDKVNIFLNE